MVARKTQLRRGRGGALQQVKKGSGFTPAKQKLFLLTLAETCNVTASARRARIGQSTVRRWRRDSADFRARWATAVREAYANLEIAMLERMMNGTVKAVTHADGSVDRTHEYPNQIALTLLRLHRETAEAAAIDYAEEEIEEVRERLARKIEKMKARLGSEGRTPAGGAPEVADDPSPPTPCA